MEPPYLRLPLRIPPPPGTIRRPHQSFPHTESRLIDSSSHLLGWWHLMIDLDAWRAPIMRLDGHEMMDGILIIYDD